MYVTPKEVFHAFTHHVDTEHTLGQEHGLHISNQHHHCELLKVDQQFTASDIEVPFYNFEKPHFYFFQQKKSIYITHSLNGNAISYSQRGPPSI